MKLYQIIALQDFFKVIGDQKLPIKTTYKLSKLARKVEEETSFYFSELNKILEEYAQKKDGQYIFLGDGSSIAIIKGKEEECSNRMSELQNLEIQIPDIYFTIEEIEKLDITLSQFDLIFPLIKD